MRLILPSTRVQMDYWLSLPWPQRLALLRLWGHRVGMFTVLNLLDDPAWLALMFC